jgi:hypothetical protein
VAYLLSAQGRGRKKTEWSKKFDRRDSDLHAVKQTHKQKNILPLSFLFSFYSAFPSLLVRLFCAPPFFFFSPSRSFPSASDFTQPLCFLQLIHPGEIEELLPKSGRGIFFDLTMLRCVAIVSFGRIVVVLRFPQLRSCVLPLADEVTKN